jgi:3-phenylpropionate/trans-cinnamate dioxygenase ferredoxin reductase subunit
MRELTSVVVVGGGAAGVSAVEALRREGYTGRLTLVGDEPVLPYDRPPLSKQVLTGQWDVERTWLRAAEHYRDLDVALVQARVVALDPVGRRLSLDVGTELPFDGAVLAPGMRVRRLPDGHHLTGVHVLRDCWDAQRLRTAFLGGGRVVVIGAGFLGLEVASSARALGLAVAVVDPAPQPMLRQLGPRLGAAAADLHRANGVGLHLGTGVAELRGAGGRVAAVALTDGTVLPADCVLVAIGATPAVDWLADSGLPLGDGIECDEYCRAAPGIHAAGDAASWFNPRYGRRMRLEHRTNAAEQGAAAAYNLLHGPVKPFAPLPYFWTDQAGVKIQAYGLLCEGSDVSVEFGSPDEGRFVAAYRTGGRLTGVVGWNAPAQLLPYRKELLHQEPVPAGGA